MLQHFALPGAQDGAGWGPGPRPRQNIQETGGEGRRCARFPLHAPGSHSPRTTSPHLLGLQNSELAHTQQSQRAQKTRIT